jgi:hypothetical protein
MATLGLYKIYVMAENIPSIPTGAVPPKKETGKVQPKKETVRINLPPKPSAAPTIKLPTLPPGGPGGAPSASAPAPSLSSAPHATAAPRATAAPTASSNQRQQPAAQRPVPQAAAGARGSGLDTALAITAAVAALAASGVSAYLIWGLPQ